MALIKCSECGKEVSDKATSCPNCGAPIAAKEAVTLDPKSHAKVTRTGAKWEGIGFALILIGIITAIAANGALGGILAFAGFVVFIIGRFL
jgi:DNA-directed RNA polymerase subunit RPC12/RpoP